MFAIQRVASFPSRYFSRYMLHDKQKLSLLKMSAQPRESLHTSRAAALSYKKHGAVVTETATSQKDKSPIVVILGWNGALDRHLAKYSDIFTQKNYGTFRVTANAFDTFCRLDGKVKDNALKYLQVLGGMDVYERPVIFYAFSQGGGAVFYHMMQAITMPQSEYFGKIKVAGTIFDSCPLKLDITGKQRLLSSITDNMSNPILKTLVWYGLGIVVEVGVHASSIMPHYMDDMKASSLICNQLVLYSKADLYSPHEDITDYIDARRKRGVHVVSKCWENSPHVSHFKEYPEEYLGLVNDFVHDCLLTAKKETFSSKL